MIFKLKRSETDNNIYMCGPTNNIQVMHGCKWNIQLFCPEVDMSS